STTPNGMRAASPRAGAVRGGGPGRGGIDLAAAARLACQSMPLWMQQFLNFLPLPQGQGSFREIFMCCVSSPPHAEPARDVAPMSVRRVYPAAPPVRPRG